MIQKYSQLTNDIRKTNLTALFRELNRKYFDNKVPEVPITWAGISKAYGQAHATMIVSPNGAVKEVQLKGIKISNKYQFTPELLEKIMLHEMIHVHLMNQVPSNAPKWLMREYAGHEGYFQNEIRRLKYLGVDVPLSEDIEDVPVSGQKIPASLIFITKRGEDQYSVAKLNKKYLSDLTPEKEHMFFDMLRRYRWTYNNPIYAGISTSPLTIGIPVARDIRNLSSYSITEEKYNQLLETLDNKVQFTAPQTPSGYLSALLPEKKYNGFLDNNGKWLPLPPGKDHEEALAEMFNSGEISVPEEILQDVEIDVNEDFFEGDSVGNRVKEYLLENGWTQVTADFLKKGTHEFYSESPKAEKNIKNFIKHQKVSDISVIIGDATFFGDKETFLQRGFR
jgi:hypothetical protein